MRQLVVRDLEEELVVALEQRAVRNGRSAEDETRAILRDALQREVEADVSSHQAIDALYDQLARLVACRRPGHPDAALEQRVGETLEQLRRLQEAEAQAMRARFKSRLTMPIDAGQQALDQAEAFLTRVHDEDRSP